MLSKKAKNQAARKNAEAIKAKKKVQRDSISKNTKHSVGKNKSSVPQAKKKK